MDKTLYVVSGFMRTGSSCMMKALEEGGLEAMYAQSRDEMKSRYADEHYDPNIGGLYELDRKEYLRLNFPEGYEGKLIKALNKGVPLMNHMPDGIRVVFMRRDSEEVRQSYNAFFNSNLENTHLLDEKMERTIKMIENRKDVLSCTEVWYREMVDCPECTFKELKKVGWPIDVKKAASVVDKKYLRFKKEELDEGVL